MKRSLTLLIIALLLIGSQVMVQKGIDARKAAFLRRPDWRINVPWSGALKIASLGYQIIVSDFYWLTEIQYFAERNYYKQPMNDLYPLADFITDLDPQFKYVYLFTSTALTMEERPLKEVRLILEKGLKVFPDEYKLHFTLGFANYFLKDGDYKQAIIHLNRAAELSGDKNYALLASRIATEHGDPVHSIEILSSLRDRIPEEHLRDRIDYRIKLLTILVQLNDLNDKVELYKEQTGKEPESAEDLFASGVLSKDQIPRHPLGGVYFFSKSAHKWDTTVKVPMGTYRVKDRDENWVDPLKHRIKVPETEQGSTVK